MSRFGQTEKVLFAIALLMLVAFSYFLYDDSLLFPRHRAGQLEVIGDVAQSQNDVRRKNLDTFSWLPAQQKDQVYDNDSIYTGERSEAIIRLSGGGQIRVQPNSLITLNMKNGQMLLDLRYGDLVGDLGAGKGITIKSGNEEFKLEAQNSGNSSIRLKKAHSGNVDLKLLSGGIKYVDPKKSTSLNLNKNTAVAVSAKGDVKPIETPVLTVDSADNVHWKRVHPDDPLPFKWSGKGNIARYEVEISPQKDFATVVASKPSTQNAADVTDPLADGQYFWRIKAYDKDGQVSAVSQPRTMGLTNLGSPQIVTPIAQAELRFESVTSTANPYPKASTRVQWQAPSEFKNFTWQLSTEKDFSRVTHEGQTSSLTALSPDLGSGTYWVRVKGLTADQRSSMWSPPVPFSMNVVAKQVERLAAPVLISKNIDFKIPNGKDRNPASPASPKLEWKPVLKSQGYKVEISKDPSFRHPQAYNVQKTDVLWSQYRPGKYYYRVYARGEAGTTSPSSEVGTIDIPFSELVLNPVRGISSVGAQKGPMETMATWSPVPAAKSYLVQIDNKDDFSSATKVVYSTTQGNIVLPAPGRYNVRVQARDEQNQPLTGFSNVQQVLYSNRPPLSIPKLLEPFNNASIFLQTASEPFIWLEWNKVADASAYRLELATDPEFTHIVLTKVVPANRYLVKEGVPLGKIYWRVRAEAKEDLEFSDWAKRSEFTLHHQKNETFVK